METEPSRHGYWGPLPGESPELYKALGAPAIEKIILEHVPNFWHGTFNMEAGRDLGVKLPGESTAPPAVLSREEKLQNLVHFTKNNEVAHLATFALVGACSAVCATEGGAAGISSAVALGTLNVISHIPPIIVQRYNRLRAYRLLDRIQRSD